MPMYYELSSNSTTSSSAGSQSTSCAAKLLTGTGVSAAVKGVYAAARGGTAGGGILRVFTAGTAQSSSGSTATLQKRNSNYATAVTSAMTATTCSQTSNERTAVGFAQTGGMGGWVAIEPDAAILLQAGGGANGNAEFTTIANAASVTFDYTVELSEQ
jgi:hypothetical protein